MNKSLEEVASARLDRWRKDGLWRKPSVFTRGQVPESSVRTAAENTARKTVLFSSSNYLGLAEHPEIKSAVKASVDRYGAGSGGSRLTTGTSDLHVAVEAAAARLTGYPDAVFFATGYQANLSTLQAVASPEVTIISDARNHASIIDGCRLARASGASLVVASHRDTRAVEQALAGRTTKYALVVTDGLFSMDGVLAPLPELSRLAREYGAWLMVDDAHSFGTIGDRGLGLPEYFGVQPDIQVITASKALGAEGGLVATSKPVAQLLRQQARSFVFSTSPTPATSAAVLAALKLMEADPSPVSQLQDNIAYWHHTRGTTPQQGPIIPVHVGNEAAAMSASAALLDRGFFVPAIRWPTVARGAALLRVTLMATHTRTQIDALCAELEQLGL